MTVVGSGRFVGVTPHVENRKLVLVDAIDGTSKILETGDLRSLVLSPDRRVAAISEQTTSFNLVADQPLSEKDQLRRHRLMLVDLGTGRRTDVCEKCDIRTIKPLWRPDGGAILFGGTVDGAAQADLTGWTYDLASRTVALILPKSLELVDAMSLHGPTDLARAWVDGQPILFARPANHADGRFDWYRVDGSDAHCLTCSLAQAGADLVQADRDEPIMVIGGNGWRLGAGGATMAFEGDGALDVPSGGVDRASRGFLT